MNHVAKSADIAIAVLLVLLPSAVLAGDEPPVLIHVEDGQIVLENDVGCRLVLHEENGRYGLGTFFLGSSDSRMRQSSPKRHRLLLSPRRQGRIEKRNPYSASEYGFLFSDSSCVWGELASEPLTVHLLASTHASFG